MKNILKGIAWTLLSMLLAVSCEPNLLPAWKSGKEATITLMVNTLPSGVTGKDSTGGRAVIQGGGYLYIQTGLTAADAVLYGPYQVTPGTALEIQDIPPAFYPFIALVYTDGIKSDSKPVVISGGGTDNNAEYRSALAATIGDPATFSYLMLTDVNIIKGTANPIKATLVPLTADTVNAGFSSASVSFPLQTSAGQTARRFVKLENAGLNIPAGNTLKSVTISMRNASGTTAQFGRLDLYNTDGSLLEASPNLPQTLAPSSMVTPQTLTYGAGTDFFAYVEYSGSAMYLDIKYELAGRLLAISSDGSSRTSIDGSTWQGPNPTGLTTCNTIAFGGSGQFAAGGTSGAIYGLATSSDGKTWTMRTLPGTVQNSVISISANPAGQLLAVTYVSGTNSAYTSSDGSTWMGPYALPYSSTNATWFEGKWYLTNSNGSSWKSSPDGAVWSSVTGTGSGMYQLNTVTSVNGKLISGGGDPGNAAKRIQISSDSGLTFGTSIPINTAAFYVTAFGVTATNRLIAIGSGSTQQINWSDDSGTSWTASTCALTGNVRAICCSPLGIFTGGDEATIYRSTNNAAGFSLSGPASAAVTGIAWGVLP